MKKQKKQKPKQKRPAAPRSAPVAPAKLAKALAWPRAPSQSLFSRINLPTFDRRIVPGDAFRRSAIYGQARATAASYSSDDRQALALLLLPFLLLAFAIGSSHALRWSPPFQSFGPDETAQSAQPSGPAIAVETAQVPRVDVPSVSGGALPVAATPALMRSLDAANQSPPVTIAEVPPLIVALPPDHATQNLLPSTVPDPAPSQSAPPSIIATAPPAMLSIAPGSPPALARASQPVESPASAAPGNPASLKTELAIAIVVAAPPAVATVIATPVPAVEATPAKPVELAALPQELEPPLPSFPVTSEPAARPSNVCVADAVKPIANATRIASLDRSDAGAVDPIAFGMALAASAREQLDDFTVYTDQYRTIAYPNGDVPAFYGVCTDVVIRAYRGLGIDLQALVHQSKLGSGDTNIDHRRVGTLQKYFSAFGESLPITEFAEDYWPGDVVTYYRPQNAHSRSHIAIVSDVAGPSGNFMIIHNRGWGPQQEDALFVDQMTGHYRYSAVRRPNAPAVSAAPGAAAAGTKAHAIIPAAGNSASRRPVRGVAAGSRASLAPMQTATGEAFAR